jgi:hypothetical protein
MPPICMYVCMYIYTHTHTRTHTHTQTHTHTHTHTHTYIYICIYIQTYIYIYMPIISCVCVCVCVCVSGVLWAVDRACDAAVRTFVLPAVPPKVLNLLPVYLLYWYKSTNTDVLRRVRVLDHAHNCSVCLLYWYKTTNTGTEVQLLTYCNV